jgi:PAS domain S-box-containing protein
MAAKKKQKSLPAPLPPDLTSLCLAITAYAPLPIASVDGVTHTLRYVNPAFCRLMNKPEDQILGKPISEFLPKKDMCISLLDRVARTGEPESHMEHEDSKSAFWSYTMWPVRTDDLHVGIMIQVTETAEFHRNAIEMNEALLLSSLRQHELTEATNIHLQEEIVERKKNEDALRESEHRYRSLFNSIDEGFCIIEMIFDKNKNPVDYRFLEVNPSFEKQTGIKNAQGKRIREIAPDHEAHWFEIYGKVALTGKAVRFVKEAKTLHRWYDVYAFRFGAPEQQQVALIFSDITERKQSEEALRLSREEINRHATNLEKQVAERTTRLRETVEELESFSYSVSHDMRAPLRAMQNFSSILLEEHSKKLDAEAVGYLEKIKSAAARQDALIQDVLIYTRVLRAETPLQPVDLHDLVKEVIETYSHVHAADAEIKIEGKLPLVRGNPAALTQCISNLLGNAVKFVAPGVKPRVKVWAEKIDSDALIWVEDNGIGIERRDRERIFKMFERVPGTKAYGGTGIGLAIVRKAMERMGGKVGVESEPGKGSRFWFQLQRA